MQAAIVHYHLNRGGVTQVILNHLKSLALVPSRAEPFRVVVFHGGRKEAWQDETVAALAGLHVTLAAIPELEYDTTSRADPERLFNNLTAEMDRLGLHADDTVVHIHNHALGKNTSLPGAVRRLSQAGFALLLQIHDFAEDFRPENYGGLVTALARHDPAQLAERIYPQGSAIHYAVLNGRDFGILKGAGIDPHRLHELPNPVSGIGALPDRAEARRKLAGKCGVGADQPYALYPVRGIRRKNVGELLLWGAVCGDETRFGLTLPPLNPVERPRYAAWKQLAQELDLPVLFEVGAEGGLEFGENLAAADQIITTSVAEGFGMVFLETWLANLPLVGRDLPEITADFVAAGLEFPQLRSHLKVPIDWIGADRFEQEMRQSYAAVVESYGRPQPESGSFHQQVAALFADGLLDFARCSARLQALVVTQVAKDPRRQDELRQLNSGFAPSMGPDQDAIRRCTAANAQAVHDHYSLESSGMRLRNLYHTVLESPRGEQWMLPQGATILDAFLSLPRFNPIRID